ncbi:hypothetical protein V6N11_025928 [Hibiscus sabdariffa]|uniref:Uncharacterized protein n=1 Tax=Hibiscus sabdariffa TaxID=183260 RepID=A0ABR2SU48_9ROSI
MGPKVNKERTYLQYTRRLENQRFLWLCSRVMKKSAVLPRLHDLRFSIVANNTFPGVVVFSFSSLAVSSILCYRPFSLNRPLIF